MTMARIYLAVGIGGMLGASVRFLISELFGNVGESGFPWATFFVNVTGALILTFLLFLPRVKARLGEAIFIGVTTGVLGAYTTFSLVIIEIHELFLYDKWMASLYIVATVFIGFFSSYLGYYTANRIANKEAT